MHGGGIDWLQAKVQLERSEMVKIIQDIRPKVNQCLNIRTTTISVMAQIHKRTYITRQLGDRSSGSTVESSLAWD